MPAVRKVTAVWARQLADLLEARGRPANLILREVGLDRAQIAYLLGYSEPSAFSHAFRRRTGQSPIEYRAVTA